MVSMSWLTDHLFEIIVIVAVLLFFVFVVLVSGLVFKGADWVCTMYLKSLEQGGILDIIKGKIAEQIIRTFNFKCGIVV